MCEMCGFWARLVKPGLTTFPFNIGKKMRNAPIGA
ncbi:MAG: hypothetical protein RL748_3481 [Pseudomonadota bacterium]